MGRLDSEGASASRSRIRHRFVAVGAIPLLATMLLGAPAAIAADSVTLTTPYPAVAAAPGTKVSFTISVTTDVSERVDLASRAPRPTGRPSSSAAASWWMACNRHEGHRRSPGREHPGRRRRILHADQRRGDERGRFHDHPAARHPGHPQRGRLRQPHDRRAAGEGPSTTTFSFNLTLHNDTSEDLTFGATATDRTAGPSPRRWARPAPAASTIVKAGDTTSVAVSATAPTDITAGQYPISVDAISGSQTAHADLAVEITGSYKVTLTTSDGGSMRPVPPGARPASR